MKDKQPLVYFIIVCWNNKEILKECLESVQSQSYRNHKTILVDNDSADDSVAFVKKHFPWVDVIQNKENVGFCIANNMGIASALGNKDTQYVSLLNTDARIAPDWLETLVTFGQSHKRFASLQTPTYDYYDHDVLDSRGILIDHQGRAVQLGHRQPKRKLPDTRVFGTHAAANLFNADFLRQQPFGDDYLDSDIWMYLDDVDLAARGTILGWENWLVGSSAAYHMGSASTSKNPGFSIYMSYRNNLYVIIKNLPLSIILRILPGMIFTDLQSIYRHVRGHNRVAIKAMVRARFVSLFHFGVYLPKRRAMMRARKISTSQLWALMQDRPL